MFSQLVKMGKPKLCTSWKRTVKLGLIAQKLTKKKKKRIFPTYVFIHCNGDLLPERLKSDYICLYQKAFVSPKHGPKKYIPNLKTI